MSCRGAIFIIAIRDGSGGGGVKISIPEIYVLFLRASLSDPSSRVVYASPRRFTGAIIYYNKMHNLSRRRGREE